VDEDPVAVALAEVLGRHHDVAQARGGRDDDLDVVGPALGLGRQQGLVGGEAGLALPPARPRGPPPPPPLPRPRPPARPPRPPPRRPAAPASARARRSSCPATGCRGRGPARGSSRRRCRGSSGRGSPPPPSPGTPAGTARARPPTPRRGGSSARRGAACPA